MFLDWEQLPKILIAIMGGLLLVGGARWYKIFILLPGIGLGAYLGILLSLEQNNEIKLLLIGSCSIIGMVLSLLVEKLAVAILGALLGGAIVQYIFPILGWHSIEWYWSAIGAVFGGMVIYPIFPKLLPFLSSFVGAYCIGWCMNRMSNLTLIGGLTLFGVIFQGVSKTKTSLSED